MRYFFSRRVPPFARVLLVESGSRRLLDKLLPHFYEAYDPAMELDVLTCFASDPPPFLAGRGRVFRVQDYAGDRGRLVGELRARRYSVMGIICSGEPMLAKYKWALAGMLPVKLLVINENGDYFWVDRGNLRTMRRFMAHRAGFSGAGLGRTLARFLIFPFTLAYLLLFAAGIHIRRQLRRL
jgi:hypothetical protein